MQRVGRGRGRGHGRLRGRQGAVRAPGQEGYVLWHGGANASAAEHIVSDPPLPLLFLLAATREGQKAIAAAAAVVALPGSSDADKAAAKAEAIAEVDAKISADAARAGEHIRANARAAS